MIEAILSALPVLVRWVPELAKVLQDAVAGDRHPFEEDWCAHVAGLEDVCAAIRDKDASTVQAVHRIVGADNHELQDALARLRARAQ